MNKQVYFGLTISEISIIVIYEEFSYYYLKPKFGEKSKTCYMDTDGCRVYIENKRDLHKRC